MMSKHACVSPPEAAHRLAVRTLVTGQWPFAARKLYLNVSLEPALS
jgi:hypothetical protein